MSTRGRRGAARGLCAALLLACVVGISPAAQQEPQGPITLERVIDLMRAGIPPANIVTLIERQGGSFHLTVDDVVRLRKMGATSALILAMAAGVAAPDPPGAAPAPGGEDDEAPPPAPPAPGTLSTRDVTRALRRSDAASVVRRIETEGMRRPPGLDELVDLFLRGVPPEVIRAMAIGAVEAPPDAAAADTQAGSHPGAAAGAQEPAPLDPGQLAAMLKSEGPDALADALYDRGLSRPLSLDEVLKLRAAGANDDLMAVVHEAGAAAASPAAAGPEPAAGEPEEVLEDPDRVAIPAPARGRRLSHVPSDPSEDRLWVASVPPGSQVYLVTGRTRPEDAIGHGHFVGRTPVSLAIPPGDYLVVVQHDAGEFEEGLAPGWRTVHDGVTTRSLLDNADLTFDPAACCLPGSLHGEAELRPVPRDIPRALIGDSFDGLPPYLFDGEILQVLRVRDTRIEHTMKLYRVRKSAGRSRILISTFLPSEGDPLDQNEVSGLPPGNPYDAWVDAPGLDFLREAAQLAEAAGALGVTTAHLGEAVAMLRRAGKAILHQQLQGGVRLMALSVEDGGQVRLVDREIRPVSLFEPPPAPEKKKKKARTPPPPPALPALERVVLPGMGLPLLTIHNTTARSLGLLLEDGRLCWVPAGARREFQVDPGSHEARLLGAAFDEMNPAPRGRLHFSYNARYTIRL